MPIGLSPMEQAMRNGVIAPSKLGKWTPIPKVLPIGPAGLQIPFERGVYRPTIEEQLLGRIIGRAFGDWAAAQLPDSWRDQVIEIVSADIDRRFPAEDRTVLKRHGFTAPTDRFHVHVRGGFWMSHRAVDFDMLESRDLPHRVTWYAADVGEPGNGPSKSRFGSADDPQVPASALPYFRKWDEVMHAERDQFRHAISYPSQFKGKNKRWPLWGEIEAAWPRLAAWLDGQRRQMPEFAKSHPPRPASDRGGCNGRINAPSRPVSSEEAGQ